MQNFFYRSLNPMPIIGTLMPLMIFLLCEILKILIIFACMVCIQMYENDALKNPKNWM